MMSLSYPRFRLYGIGDVETYADIVETGKFYEPMQPVRELVALQYQRNEIQFARGCFRAWRYRNLPSALRRPRMAALFSG